MRLAAVLLALTLPLAAACEGERPDEKLPANSMTVRIDAPADATYTLRCQFRAIELPGRGPVNNVDLSGTGPRADGYIPTDNGRCTLEQTGGAGPVTVTVDAPNGAVTATVAGPGQTARLQIV